MGEAGAEAEAEAETVLAGGVKIHTESMEMGVSQARIRSTTPPVS